MEKVALVTGCSSGIGFTTSLELARKGYYVYATMRDLNKKSELESIVQRDNLNIKILEVDVTKNDTITKSISQIESEKSRIDVLVNNAGYGMIGAIEDQSIDEIKEIMDTDFFGAMRMIQSVLPIMRKNKSGRIINVSSIAGRIGFGFSSAYSCSKFALEALTESMRYELSSFGIITTTIEPGVVKTKFHEKMKISSGTKTDLEYKNVVEQMSKNAKILFERGMDPKKVAEKILEILNIENPSIRYTVGEDAEYIMYEKQRSKSDLEFEESIKKIYSEVMNLK